MRILVRTSKLSIWARRMALFAAAVLVVSTILHLIDQIAADAFEISLIIATIVAAFAFALGLIAYVRLWFTGDRGWGPASVGFGLGLLCLVPAGATMVLAELYPSTADVTTAFTNPPELTLVAPNHPKIDPETVLATFPNLITRIYRIPPDTLFALGEALVRENGWSVLEAAAPSTGSVGELSAVRRSLFGWENEIAFRITPNPIGALIDLRAASLEPTAHDLGDNGRAIESFLLALDQSVSSYVQDNLSMTEEEALDVIGASQEPETQPQ